MWRAASSSRARAREVLTTAQAISAREAKIEAEVRAGAALPHAMRYARLAGTDAQ